MKASRKNSAPNRCIVETLESRQMMAAGGLDPTFGVGGKIIAETIGFPVADLAVQADGKVIAVGTRNGDFAVARLNADGKLDRAFGGNGIAQSDLGGRDFANAVVIQPDGKIVVAGIRGINTTFRMVVARYNPNGTLDNTFDGNGKLSIDLKQSGANALALQPDGKILVAGGMNSGVLNNNNDFAVVRLLFNGSLDNTFGSALPVQPLSGVTLRSGHTIIDFHADTGFEEAKAVALAPDGKIVVGGLGGNDHDDGPLRLAVARLSSNGTLDKSFGDGISGDGKFNNFAPGVAVNFRDMHIGADGSVTIAGGINGNFLTVRLTSLGRLDGSFGNNGRVETDLGGNDDAKHVNIKNERILVAGGSSGHFAMVRYRLNGELDQSFGNRGQVHTDMAAGDAILTTKLTNDGKILAFGRSGSVARYFGQVTPIIEVLNRDTDASEAANQPGSILIKRDGAYDFTTRVFLDISSPAVEGVDYTSPVLQRAPIFSVPGSTGSGTLTPVQLLGFRHFVEIPAGQASLTATINPKADTHLEGNEVVRWAPIDDASYQLGAGNAGHVTIHDNSTVRVNFQKTGGIHTRGYEPDRGLPFGTRETFETYEGGLRYGWDADNTANARDRDPLFAQPGFNYNTFNHMQKPGGGTKWEIAVPNGMYEVKLAAGDPQNVDSVYRMNLEGQLALSGTPGGLVRWFERTVRVQVNDGRLTLTNAAGAVNNKIAFIEIKSAAPGTAAGSVTGNIPVSLPREPLTFNPPEGGTIFSQLRI